jgi:hypothetical protein
VPWVFVGGCYCFLGSVGSCYYSLGCGWCLGFGSCGCSLGVSGVVGGWVFVGIVAVFGLCSWVLGL